MRTPVVILGGGLSGLASALALAAAGARDVTVLEAGPELGGLAGSFERDGYVYPIGYHHILPRDRTLRFVLDRIGVLHQVHWRRAPMLFEKDGDLFDLARLIDLIRFPLPFGDKLALARLVARSRLTSDWSAWRGRSAAELTSLWGSEGVRQSLFEPLTRLKFDLPCSEVCAAWVGRRLSYREGSASLGYIPETNWTKVLCDGLTHELEMRGVRAITSSRARALETSGGRVVSVETEEGRRFAAGAVISTLPPPIYRRLNPADESPVLDQIRYTSLVSCLTTCPAAGLPSFYWLNLTSLEHTACALFRLEALNPTIGPAGETVINFVIHSSGAGGDRDRSDEELMDGFRRDFRDLFGRSLAPRWYQINRVPAYSPIFDLDYRNPPVRSPVFENVFFAGNYRMHPTVASTGSAMASGFEAADALLGGGSPETSLAKAAQRFRG